MIERRKHRRFNLVGNCLISHGKLMGTIIDLSMGGLSFSCLSSNSPDYAKSLCDNVEIVCTENVKRFPGLTMEILDSEKIPGKFLQNFWVTKYRAHFINLQIEQIALLENLIDTVTQQIPWNFD